MRLNLRNIKKLLLLLILVFGFLPAVQADPDDPFPLSPAPLWENIQGTWVTANYYPIYFRMCQVSRGVSGEIKIRVARVLNTDDQSRIMYQELALGDSQNRSVNFSASDINLGVGRVKVRLASYFADEYERDVVLRLEALSVFNPLEPIKQIMLRKISDRTPDFCRNE